MNAHERDDFDTPDSVDELRRAWDELPTPPIERLDAIDRAVEGWARAAWSHVTKPVARRRPRWRPSFVSALAAAALFCVAVGLGLRDQEPTANTDAPHKNVVAIETAPSPRTVAPSVVSTLDAALPPASRTQVASNRLVDQAYASNRAGLYREAAAFATVALEAEATSAEVRCAALVNRIHAEQALGRVDEAERLSTTLALALSR